MLKSEISLTKLKTVKRVKIISLTLIAFAAFLLINILRIDLYNFYHYKQISYDQITTSSKLKANRGNIYDSEMNILATNKTSWRVFVSTKEINSSSRKDNIDYAQIISTGLGDILNKDWSDIYKKISTSNMLDVTIEDSATEDEYNSIISFISANNLDNLILTEAQTVRYYPQQTFAAHVLGFTGSDNQGLYGLEYSYNKILTGKDGYYLYAKDAAGNAMPGQYMSIEPAIDGYSIVTTIDSYVQAELESQLEQIRVNHSVQNRVTGVVMDTSTGAILAMATSSPFDPNTPFELDDQSKQRLNNSGLIEGSTEYKNYKNELMQIMWSNKAVSETYEPGSTFKIITVSTALDLGVADENDTFSCNGYHMVGGWKIKCHKTTGHGTSFPLSYGLQMSCNPTMMVLADKIGAESFYNYIEKFGYFEKTGIDLPSEASTIFHKLENIGPTELATVSFGQRFKVTVINHLTAISAVANGGYLVEPYVVSKIIDNDGNVISSHGTVVKRKVISSDTGRTVTSILEEGVSGDGGAKNAYVDGYLVAAKTGTSQKFDVLDSNGNSYLRIGSTVAYVSSDSSGIAAIIVVDEPESEVKYGSVIAAPYISNLLTKILPHLEYKSQTESTVVCIDDFTGADPNNVKKALDESGIKCVIIGNGSSVLSQVPESGITILKAQTTVYIYTEKRDEEYVTVPSLVGKSIKDANVLIANTGLNIRVSGHISSECSTLTVLSQNLPSGALVPIGTVITVSVLGVDFED